MRDHFELLDLIVYFMACGLLLPVVSLIGRDNVWSVSILCALMIPLPLYMARLRYSIPARLDAGKLRVHHADSRFVVDGHHGVIRVLT